MPDEKLVEELARMLAAREDRERLFTDSDLTGRLWDGYRDEFLGPASAVLEWLSERGRLVPDGGLTRTEWAVTTPRGKQIHYVYDEVEARTCAIYGPRRIPVSRQVTNWPDGTMLTTRWVPVPDDTWRPAKPGETPGALVPGEGDVPQPVDLPAPVGVPVPDNTRKEVGDVET